MDSTGTNTAQWGTGTNWMTVARKASAEAARRAFGRSRIDLKDKVVLVMGGSRGLGLLLARALGKRGARIALCARDEVHLIQAQEALQRDHIPSLIFTCDVGDRARVEATIDDVHKQMGKLDILINNASIISVGPLESMQIEDFEKAMAANFWGGVYATLAALPHLKERPDPRIVNIVSIGGKVAVPHLLPYSCAKFAIAGFSEGLAAELRKDGIRVTTVVPGLMRTGSPVNADFKDPAEFAWFGASDSSRLTSMDAELAASRIVRAIEHGESQVTLGWQAKLLRVAHALLPTLTVDALSIANDLLPHANGHAGDQPRELRGRDVLEQLPKLERQQLEHDAHHANQN